MSLVGLSTAIRAQLLIVAAPKHRHRWLQNLTLLNRSMSSGNKTHLERTLDKPRDSNIHNVKVTELANLSPTVKKVVLTSVIRPAPFTFKAGQWVDLFVPGIDKIGGFTITSSPIRLEKTDSVDLAIQYSTVQPAFWIHTECKLYDELSIRVGGDFYFDTDRDHEETKGILLLAGGVGINPLSAIIRQIHEKSIRIPVVLLYSAKSEAELIFRDDFKTFVSETDRVQFFPKFFVTGPSTGNGFETGRINFHIIKESLRYLASDTDNPHNIKVFICGPPPMIKEMEETAKKLKLSDIAYEKWW